MRLFQSCMACLDENGGPDIISYQTDLLDGNIAKFKCRRGHDSIVMLQSHKFELLAELAINAIHDGYTREAVSSFASSLERFYEFYIKIVFKSEGFEDDEFRHLWKTVSKQTARQLGAYIFVYKLEERQTPKILDTDVVKFRNNVIHQSLIPTKNEAIEFGQSVIDVINSALSVLRNSKMKAVGEIKRSELLDIHRNLLKVNEDSEISISTLSMPTLLNSTRSIGEDNPTVSAWLERVERLSIINKPN